MVSNWIITKPLADKIIFKGGTALRRCHFADYRFSEDLDYTLLSPLFFDEIKLELENVYKEVKLVSNITFQFSRPDQHSHQVKRVNHISKYPLVLADALEAYAQLKNTPEFFRRYIEQYITNPLDGSPAALDATKAKVFNDESFKRQWDALLAADQVILAMIAAGIYDLHGKTAMQHLGKALGIGNSVDKNTSQNALRRLSNKNIITKIDYGIYQFEDEAFADWVKHRE